AFIDAYFKKFPGIRDYMEDTKAFAKKHGFVETLFGRKIHTPGIQQKGPHRGFAERAAVNAPIQGSAADIIRRAMIRLPSHMASTGRVNKKLLQVHDELLFEVEEDWVSEFAVDVRAYMESAAQPAVRLDVPVLVEQSSGKSWAAAH
ncbi:MAG: DNA polymerase, partial [Pseudomonadota bacterium]